MNRLNTIYLAFVETKEKPSRAQTSSCKCSFFSFTGSWAIKAIWLWHTCKCRTKLGNLWERCSILFAWLLKLFPKRWQSLLTGMCLSLADGCFSLEFIQFNVLHWLGFFRSPPPSITFIFQRRPAACIFDKYLSSTVNAHRLKNDLWVKPEQIPTRKGISFSKGFFPKLCKQKLLECMLWMLYLCICDWASTAF